MFRRFWRRSEDLDEEIAHFLDESAADLESRGVPAAQARRDARGRWGHAVAIREGVRDAAWEHIAATFAADVRHGARRLRHTPGFTLVSVLTLALGIGASTAIFSAVNPILFARLPYPESGRLALVLENGRSGAGTFAMYRTLASRTASFDALAVFRRWQPTLTGPDVPERVEGQRVSADFFTVLGVRPAIGRGFIADDDRRQGPAVAIVSDALWRRLGADPAAVGRPIRLDDTPYTVLGVMPAGFENVLAPEAQIWTPLQYDDTLPPDGREWGHHLTTVARMAKGVTLERASRDTNAAGRAMIEAGRPETYDPNTQLSVEPLHTSLVRGVRPVLLAMAGAVLLLLVIACVNVTNLLLARGAQRRGEFALRAALGAGRARLVRQLLTEAVLLALMSGVAGVAFAVAAVRVLVAIAPRGLPRAAAIHVDGQVLLFALALTTIVGLAFGLLPALEAAGTDPHRDIQAASHRTAGGHGRTRRLLVVAEVALAFILLIGAGLLMRSVRGLLAVPPGFDAANLLTVQVQLAGHRYDGSNDGARFFQQALEAVRRVPGVETAGATTQLPLSGDRDEYGAHFADDRGQPAATFGVFRYGVSPGYLETAGIPIVRGRTIDAGDRHGAPLVAVVSASLAAARFGAGDALGGQLRIGPAGPFTIVGVAGNVRQLSLASTDQDAVYINADQSWFSERTMSFVVKTRADPALLAHAVQQAVWSIDKDQPVVRSATMRSLVEASEAERRFALIVFEGFALASLVLAAIGIYGMLAGGVSERTREIGLRSALGATRGQIVGLVVRQGLVLVAAGATIGLAGAAVASRGLSTLLFGVTHLDPLTYGSVIALLASVALVACSVPAWRAVRVDPSVTLRAE